METGVGAPRHQVGRGARPGGASRVLKGARLFHTLSFTQPLHDALKAFTDPTATTSAAKSSVSRDSPCPYNGGLRMSRCEGGGRVHGLRADRPCEEMESTEPKQSSTVGHRPVTAVIVSAFVGDRRVRRGIPREPRSGPAGEGDRY